MKHITDPTRSLKIFITLHSQALHSNMDAIIEQIKSLAKDADDITRKTIIDQLREVFISLETAQDAMQRISYSVRLLSFDKS
jgi:hypothetical protein